MNRTAVFWLILACFSVLPFSIEVKAFTAEGCGAGNCSDCHHLAKEEAAELLSVKERDISKVMFAEIPGLWEVDVKRRDKILPVFVDFSKQYLVRGSIIKIAEKKDIAKKRYVDLNRVDSSQIPLDDALLVGNASAKSKIIVFDDPECPYCAKLQKQMWKVVAERKDVAFFIKMFPLKNHPEAYEKAKAIVCSRSLALLEESFAGRKLKPAACKTDRVEENIRLAERIGIYSTPTLVFPDGKVSTGFKRANKILELLGKHNR